MKNYLLLFVLSLICFSGLAQTTKGGWKMTDYNFVDGTKTVDRVLAGTTDYMEDVTKFDGKKGDVTIVFNRYDKSSRALLAGVTYNVKWTDPQSQLFPGDMIKMTYSIKTISSTTWKPEQQSAKFSQGLYGINLKNSEGQEYFNKDFSGDIITSVAVAAGYKLNEEKTLTVSMGSGFKAVYTYKWDPELVKSEVKEESKNDSPAVGEVTGWYFTNYEFVDGTGKVERVLAGTTDKMEDITKFEGSKGNITIYFNRYDQSSGSLLAGVTYSVKWTDPQKVLIPGDKIKMNYTLKTITSKTWTPNQQTVSFNQGMGMNLQDSNGKEFFKTDFSSDLVSPKGVDKGYKQNEKKAITVNLGSGFKAIYNYEWRTY